MSLTSDKIKEEVRIRFDALEDAAHADQHISDPKGFLVILTRARMYHRFLDDEHNDFLHGCQHMYETQTSWHSN